MARLESQADLMYVPTPDVVCDRLREMLDLPDDVQALDPCCGTGAALRRVLGTKGTAYGIEIELDRARDAAKNLDRVLCCAAQESRLSNGAFGLVLLNPPYDSSAGEGRLESAFLRRAVDWLADGGVLVYIIKRAMFEGQIAHRLATFFTDFQHWRFPDPYFAGPELSYGQTVLVCRRRSGFTGGKADTAVAIGLMRDELQPLTPPAAKITVPAGHAPGIFLSGVITSEAAAELFASSKIRRVPPVRSHMGGRSPLPLRSGHVAMMLASGRIDGVYRSVGELPIHVAKGTVRRSEREDKFVQYGENDRPTVTIRRTEGFEVTIRTATQDGVIHDVAAPPVEVPDDAEVIEEDAA